MKPTHEYYNIPDLIDRWSKHDGKISEIDLLKWGASGKLQFSVWITTGKYYQRIDILQEYQDGTKVPGSGLFEGTSIPDNIPCKEIRVDQGGRKLCRISKNTVEFLLDDRKQDTVFPELILDCNDCKETGKIRIEATLADWWHEKYPDYDPDTYLSWREDPQYKYLNISKADLVVSHADMKQFEEVSFEPEVLTPPYLDPKHFAFNIELALAIETWTALFIDKLHINEKTVKIAAQEYLTQYENYIGDEKKYRRFFGADSTKDSSALGRIAVQLNNGLLNKKTWKEFQQKHSEETTKD